MFGVDKVLRIRAVPLLLLPSTNIDIAITLVNYNNCLWLMEDFTKFENKNHFVEKINYNVRAHLLSSNGRAEQKVQ